MYHDSLLNVSLLIDGLRSGCDLPSPGADLMPYYEMVDSLPQTVAK